MQLTYEDKIVDVCPWCGSNKIGFLIQRFPNTQEIFCVMCISCKTTLNVTRDTKEEAVDAWNSVPRRSIYLVGDHNG